MTGKMINMANTVKGKKKSSFGQEVYQLLEACPNLVGDVTFCVGPERVELKSFKFILMATSPIFQIMFNSSWDQGQEVIHLPDVQPKLFSLFVKHLPIQHELKAVMYEEMQLSMPEVLHLLYISKKYCVTGLQAGFENLFKHNVSTQTALAMYKLAKNSMEEELANYVFHFIERNTSEVVQHQEFLDLSKETIRKILASDNINIKEGVLFESVFNWAVFQCTVDGKTSDGGNVRELLGDLLYLIRFPILNKEDFTSNVLPKDILTNDEIIAIFSYGSLGSKAQKNFDLAKLPFNISNRNCPKKKAACFILSSDSE